MELDALDRQRAVPDAHHDVVVAPGRELEVGRQVRVAPPASGSAWPPSGPRGRRTPSRPSWWMRLVLPCTGSRPRTTRAPKAWPIAWCPRHTPRIGTRPASPRIASTEMPAWSGVLGPGEITRWVGAQRLDARHVHGVVAAHLHLGAQLPEVLDQVVGEAVVVVDHDDPWHRRPYQSLSRGGDLDGPEEGGRLVLGLLVLLRGHGVGHDPGAGLDVGHPVVADDGADRDAGVEAAVPPEPAHGAAVRARAGWARARR